METKQLTKKHISTQDQEMIKTFCKKYWKAEELHFI